MFGNLPYNLQQVLELWALYNHDLWPAQVLAYALGLAALGLALSKRPWAGRVVSAWLGLLWLGNGLLYHGAYYSRLDPAALAFAAVFVLQGLLFLWSGTIRGRLDFGPGPGAYTIIGGLILAFALVGYPWLSAYLGHAWPRLALFGLAPCPTVMYTFGLLMWSTGRLPKHLLALPVLWAFVGFVAAVDLGLREDVGLLVVGLVAASLLLPRDLSPRS